MDGGAQRARRQVECSESCKLSRCNGASWRLLYFVDSLHLPSKQASLAARELFSVLEGSPLRKSSGASSTPSTPDSFQTRKAYTLLPTGDSCLKFRIHPHNILQPRPSTTDRISTISTVNMDGLNSSLSSSSDVKTQIMNQVRQEAAVHNARQLIEVWFRQVQNDK
jgi:hypothetical protein